MLILRVRNILITIDDESIARGFAVLLGSRVKKWLIIWREIFVKIANQMLAKILKKSVKSISLES